MDAIDASILSFNPIALIETHSEPIPTYLKQTLHAVTTSQTNTINSFAQLDAQLGQLFAKTITTLLNKSTLATENITAIGSHGQTVFHQPDADPPFTLQIADPNIIATITNITTISDFRRRDMALGGQGAPLTPLFHAELLKQLKGPHRIVNIGGIANMTFIPYEKKPILGFDTGPGNTLLDAWAATHLQTRFDQNGDWAAHGKVHQLLLSALISDPYFRRSLPKSTGPEYFDLKWLKQYLEKQNYISEQDIQATLTDLTALSIAYSLKHYTPCTQGHLWVCGGGTLNHHLINRLQHFCHPLKMTTTHVGDIPSQWIESACFAWLAQRTLNNLPGNEPSVTGAKHHTVLGSIIPKNKSNI